jgi:L-lactate dehydrogenase complex protein LldG
MNARNAILSRIRTSQKVGSDDSSRKAAIEERMAHPPLGIIPQRGQLPKTERIALFQAMAEKYNATVTHIAAITDLPTEISAYLKARNLPARIRMGADPLLASAPFDNGTLEILHGATQGDDLVGVSHAFGGVAESGSLVIATGTDNPTTLNFLPEYHIVAVMADHIDGDMESAFARHRAIQGKGQMPRTLHFITGPSRSADIEQTILLGAHGPRALHIVIMGN